MVTLSNASVCSWISHFFACMGGCFGCCVKPTSIISMDEPSKGLRIQGWAVKKLTISEDFWSSSTCEQDNSAIQSQRSISSISASNPNTSSGGTMSVSTKDFVNHGMLLWQQGMLQWTGSGESTSNQTRQTTFVADQSFWNATYESLLGSRNPFPRPVPLSEMVDFLVDVCEQEGLYD